MMTKLTGLTNQEVAARREAGLENMVDTNSSRSLLNILRGNIITPFNGLITVLAIAVLLANQSPINSLFFIAMVLNIIIGVAQELRAKRTLDRLAIIVKPTSQVIRQSKTISIPSQEIVQDDLVVLAMGEQVPVDGEVIESQGMEVNESLLTGEAIAVVKNHGETVLSGSIVVGGNGIIRATKVGEQSYSAKITRETKQFTRASSELIEATNTIMRWIARALIIVVPVLIIGQLQISNGDWREAIIHTVAAIVGMIPEGLVLLTSMAFMLAVIKLTRKQVLVQQLPAVETLARVNTLLLDKTGTITSGEMKLEDLIFYGDDEQTVRRVLATMASRTTSPTNMAITKDIKIKPQKFTAEIPFNSIRKWSAIQLDDDNYVLGAPEIILRDKKILAQAQQLAERGLRVLTLIKVSKLPNVEDRLESGTPLALVVLSEKIRDDAAETLQYFHKQGVEIKVVSGDSSRTVGAVARSVGLNVKSYDATKLPDFAVDREQFRRIIETHNVFGRVKPEQKRQIAAILQEAGKVVAMTGDGVNDALALKKADLGIAMASGASATRAVAELVLLDDKFSHLPNVLAEGRRVVANIERVSNLFIIKNVYSITLSLAVTALGLTYPFMPAQMTVISSLSIGIPAFFLALAYNDRRYEPGFLRRVMGFALPTGFITAIAMLVTYYMLDQNELGLSIVGASVSVVTMLIGIAVLMYLARPLKGWKLGMIWACGGVFAGYILWPPLAKLFSLQFDWQTLPTVLIVSTVAIFLIFSIQGVSWGILHRKRNK